MCVQVCSPILCAHGSQRLMQVTSLLVSTLHFGDGISHWTWCIAFWLNWLASRSPGSECLCLLSVVFGNMSWHKVCVCVYVCVVYICVLYAQIVWVYLSVDIQRPVKDNRKFSFFSVFWLARTLGVCLSLFANSGVTSMCRHAPVFIWVWGIQTQILVLSEEASYPLSLLPTHTPSFYYQC